jgi:hypothetical protein
MCIRTNVINVKRLMFILAELYSIFVFLFYTDEYPYDKVKGNRIMFTDKRFSERKYKLTNAGNFLYDIEC